MRTRVPLVVMRRASHGWRLAGWTLLELLGVLAIMSILALVLIPILTRQLDRAVQDQEQVKLKQIAEAFEAVVKRTRQVGTMADFGATVAAELGWRSEAVLTNERGLRRVILRDPRFRIGPGSGGTLPFVQDWQGSVQPVGLRWLLVSSLSEPIAASITNGILASTNDFDLIWDGPAGTVPAAWGWGGQPDDLVVERIEMESAFVPVVLNNQSVAPGAFGTDTGVTNLLVSPVFMTWYLKGTVLRLHGSDGGLQTAEILQDPMSFVYEAGTWRGRLFSGSGIRELTGLDLQLAIDRFLSTYLNPGAAQVGGSPADQARVVNSVSNYMVAYINWAQEGFVTNTAAYSTLGYAQETLQTLATALVDDP